MNKFIELHDKDNGEPIIINANHITYITIDDKGCYIHLSCAEWTSSDHGHMHSIHVKESYSRVKSILFEYE